MQTGSMRALAVVLGLMAVLASAYGEDGTWQGPPSGAWSVAVNWLGGVPNSAGDEAIFPVVTNGSFPVTVDQPVTLGRLQVNGRGSLELTQAGPLLFSTDDGTGSGTIVLEAKAEDSLAARVRSDVELAEGTSRLVADMGDRSTLALYGTLLTQDLELLKTGLGTLELHGASPDWDGYLTIAGGTARVFDARALGGAGGSTTVQADAVLRLESGVDVGQEPIRLDGGTISTVGTAAISNAPIELLSDSRIVRLRGAPATLGGVISGPGGVEFVQGETTITRNNTYEGPTILANSTVVAQAATALGDTGGATIIGEQSRLRIDTRSSEPLEIRGGQVSFGQLDSLLFDGTVTMSHGLLQLEAQRSFGAGIILDQPDGPVNGEARVRGNFSEFAGGTSGVGDIVFEEVNRIRGNPLAHDGAVIYENAELQITVANTYTGTTRLRGAQLVVPDARALGASGSTVVVEQGSSLTLNEVADKYYELRGGQMIVVPSDEPIEHSVVLDRGELGGRGTFNGPIILADSPIGSRSDSLIRGGIFNGPISGQGTLVFFNDLSTRPTELNGDNSYRGRTRVMRGFVNANSSSALGSHMEATLIGGGGGVLNVNAYTNEPLIVIPDGVVNLNEPLDRLPTITGAGRANPQYPSTSAVNVNVPSHFEHDADIVHGTLHVNADTTLGSIRIRKEGALIVADDATATFAADSLEMQDGSLRGRLAGLDRIVKTTMGRAKLGPLPGYDGQIAVEQGVLNIHDPAALGSQIGATHLLGEASAELHIFGSLEIAEDIYLNNAQGFRGRGALQLFRGEDGRMTEVKLTGQIDLGDEGSVFSGSPYSAVLELAGGISGGRLIKRGEGVHLRLTSDQYTYTGYTTVRDGNGTAVCGARTYDYPYSRVARTRGRVAPRGAMAQDH